MDRMPVVAGQFYPDNPAKLGDEVKKYLNLAPAMDQQQTIMTMAPHAGYVFSGSTAGKTIGQANLHQTCILLGPNHTGQGQTTALWAKGKWLFPGGELKVDQNFCEQLLKEQDLISTDYNAHLNEHSLEVLLPFLAEKNPLTRIIPIAIKENNYETLKQIANCLVRTIRSYNEPVSLIVSSDMNHFLSLKTTREKDSLAIGAMLELQPLKLLETVIRHRISMCGVIPATLGLLMAMELGAKQAVLCDYTTSASINHDQKKVVGYAGLIVS